MQKVLLIKPGEELTREQIKDSDMVIVFPRQKMSPIEVIHPKNYKGSTSIQAIAAYLHELGNSD